MKTLLAILLWFFAAASFGQNNEMDDAINKELSNIFLGFDTTQKPEKIEEEYRMPVDIEPGDRIIPKEKNTIRFKTHKIFSGFIEGEFNVNYLFQKEYFDDLGLYQLRLLLWFNSEEECVTQYNKIVKKFELFGTTKIVETTRDEFHLERIKNEETIFIRNRNDEFPRLEISYHDHTDDGDGFAINIRYYKSCNNSDTGRIKFFNY
jgi:hypothetical protein